MPTSSSSKASWGCSTARSQAAARPPILLAGSACRDCGRPLCGHRILCAIALGFRDAPRCLPCLARGLGRPEEILTRQLLDYVRRRDCYRQAWDVACDREGQPRTRRPPCLGGETPEPTPAEDPTPVASDTSHGRGGPEVADTWDALTSDRPYRQAMPHDRALAILNDGSGTQWDPAVVAAFMAHLGYAEGAALEQHAASAPVAAAT